MRAMKLGLFCRQVLQRHSFVPLVCHCIQLSSLKASPVAFISTLQHLGCRLTGNSSPGLSEANFRLRSSKTDSSEGSQKLLQTLAISSVEPERPAGADLLNLGKVADPFLDMGLSPAQITQLFSLQPNLPPQTRLTVVSELLLLGLNTDSTLKVLQKSPELLKMSLKHLRDRADLLRRLGFEEGMNHVAIHFPSIFTLPQKKIESLERLLKEKCLFTVHQISTILQMCPNILLEELNDVEYKFQFAYFRMGVKHREIVQSGFFQASLTEIKNRLIFLERLGLYQTPDKKGQTQVVNPKLKSIIRFSETDFVTKMACSSVEEYKIFKKLLVREERRLEEQEAAMQSDLSDLESDEEGSYTE
ncbi:transcription termination factor 4, mitochondrial isoform X2 [Rhineura floridana]|uniref:transcription termination factor 4, mitochondrial isoform X2 n=1 Tax=Rhineura floridana TaxID=261503 RepID=UPI002AC86E24|nr:transcription termination factor 4, mitochondrial isoform X2 [Rhineura floridana]